MSHGGLTVHWSLLPQFLNWISSRWHTIRFLLFTDPGTVRWLSSDTSIASLIGINIPWIPEYSEGFFTPVQWFWDMLLRSSLKINWRPFVATPLLLFTGNHAMECDPFPATREHGRISVKRFLIFYLYSLIIR